MSQPTINPAWLSNNGVGTAFISSDARQRKKNRVFHRHHSYFNRVLTVGSIGCSPLGMPSAVKLDLLSGAEKQSQKSRQKSGWLVRSSEKQQKTETTRRSKVKKNYPVIKEKALFGFASFFAELPNR